MNTDIPYPRPGTPGPARAIFWMALLALGACGRAFAVSPMLQYNDLVAGSGEYGFRDGSFASALFQHPCGLAISPDASRLFIADKDNHRIRVVLLDQENLVQTLAGTGEAGSQDGELAAATFNQPYLLCSIGPQQLMVYDTGGGHFRGLDLFTHQVRTLDPKDTLEGSPHPIPNVTSMAYLAKDTSLYFTRDETLYRMDLATQLSSPLTIDNLPQTFTPGPVCFYQDHICVSDKVSGLVYSLNPSPNTSGVSLGTVGKGEKVAALASADKALYALPSTDNTNGLWMQVAPEHGAGPLPLMNLWGDILKGQALSYFFSQDSTLSPGFIADPKDKDRFFMALPAKNLIMSLRDYRFDERKVNNGDGRGDLNAGGISDFNYPLEKPPKTFRILIAGDSRSFHIVQDGRWAWGSNRMEILAKRLEVLLNTSASLDDYPVHFQVLAVGHPNSCDVLTWFSYHLPRVVQKYDVDLCIQALTPDAFSYRVYFDHPILANGIPSQEVDPEYALKPLSERAKSDPLLRTFYESCLKEHLGNPKSLSSFAAVNQLAENKVIRPILMELMGKGYERTAKEIQAQTAPPGSKRLYYLCFFPLGNLGSDANIPNEPYRDLWKEVSEKKNLHFLDLTEPFNVLKASYFHVEETNDNWHNNYHGHALNAVVLEHELIRQNLIPTKSVGPTSVSKPQEVGAKN